MIKSLIETYLGYPKHRGKARLTRYLLNILPYRSIRSHHGVILGINPKDKTNIYAISGDYGDIIYNHIKKLPKDAVFIDIGANYGLFTNIAAKHLNSGKVLAFEPNPYIYRYFLLAQQKNQSNNIVPFHCAISEEDGLLSLSYNPNHSGVSSLSHSTDNKTANLTVPAFNISRWENLNFLNESEVHIKIDVEGYEASIINVLIQSKWFKNIKSIIVEIDDDNLKSFNSSASDLYQKLSDNGFLATIGFNKDKHYDEIFIRA